jgi:predicted dehydrogenase
MSDARIIRTALVGGGMFGGDVVIRSLEDFERCGIAPYLGRIGLDERARDVAAVKFELTAIGTRTATTAETLAKEYATKIPGASPVAYHGETPWVDIFRAHDIDILFVATPDSLHHAPTLHAIENGAHVMVEKPLALRGDEAREIVERAREKGVVVGVDMHKRYDPCHRFIFDEIVPKIGTLLYGRAVLEEPLEVSTKTFKWAATSNPFSYVGVHWVDLFTFFLSDEPVSLHAVGQKKLLVNWDREGGGEKIETFDSMQVALDYASGLRVYFVNSWINPDEFEAPVNQEMELVGTRGKVEFDQQDRGLRATIAGVGTRTFNPHFTSEIVRPGGESSVYDGYGKDSIVAITQAAVDVLLGHRTLEQVSGTYPDGDSSLSSVAVLEAAALVAEKNLAHLENGRGSPVTARFSGADFEIIDPLGR